WAALLLAEVLAWNTALPVIRYLALSLTACAGVAVLGARRPGMAAWNFVLIALLAVFLLPLAQGLLTGEGSPQGIIWTVFLAMTLGVGLINYLFTRLAIGAVMLAGACTLEIVALRQGVGWESSAAGWLLALAPWAGLAADRW